MIGIFPLQLLKYIKSKDKNRKCIMFYVYPNKKNMQNIEY